MEPLKVSDIEYALQFIPADGREMWVKVGMAVKSELGDEGFSTWDYWSQSAHNYNERDTRDVWRSFKQGKIGIGTLIHEAKLQGWKPGTNYIPPKRKQTKAPPKHSPSTSSYAAGLWLRADWKTVPTHSYAMSKEIDWPAGAARSKASGKIIGQDADCVIVPIRNFQTEKLTGVQCINPVGKKQTFGQISGGGLILGNTKDKSIRWYVVEGWADAVSMVFHHHKGNAVAVAAFGKTQMMNAAKAIEVAFNPPEILVLEDAA